METYVTSLISFVKMWYKQRYPSKCYELGVFFWGGGIFRRVREIAKIDY